MGTQIPSEVSAETALQLALEKLKAQLRERREIEYRDESSRQERIESSSWTVSELLQ